MSFYKICVYLGILYLTVITHGLSKVNKINTNVENYLQNEEREDPKILVVDTNMTPKVQQQARELLISILANHPAKNHCTQYSLGFKEIQRGSKWGCFRFPADADGKVLEGSYHVESQQFIELAVTMQEPPGEIIHYLLFSVRRW